MLDRLLITGAAGGLGRAMRPRLAKFARSIRVSDIVEIQDLAAHEEQVTCDLGDAEAVMKLVQGCDGIIHLGGISVEDKFSRILNANIAGLFNLYEAARAHGRPRILFASSNHTIGYYRQDEHIDASAPMRPDSLYGVSKCFGEALARMYFDKFGQETAIVRIGSCFEKPKNHRMLATWMSYDDFEAMIDRIFTAPLLGCPIVFGVSDPDDPAVEIVQRIRRDFPGRDIALSIGQRPGTNRKVGNLCHMMEHAKHRVLALSDAGG